jgi:hypothetical protein
VSGAGGAGAGGLEGVVTPAGAGGGLGGGDGGLGGGDGEDVGDEGDKYWPHPALGTLEAAKTLDVVLPLVKLVDRMVTPLGSASVK